ncbi:MAG: DNA repair protein RecO [Ignavibacteriales bacterium]|nr:DNA repair protein RecO [Ignavibacteriales bacterium]
MSDLIKTRAIVLRKLDYGDTSRIIHLFTEDFGKISAILKGGRSGKSKKIMLVDVMNNVQIVLYKKETREVQIISEVDLLQHYPNISDDFDRMMHASAIIELLLNLTVENENNHRLYIGTARAFELINNRAKNPKLIFAKYFLFFIKEIGYEFPVTHCSICGKELTSDVLSVAYNFESGILCGDCKQDRLIHSELSKELFNLLFCLSTKKNDIVYEERNLVVIIKLLEKFLRYNIHEFKGLKSLELV